MPIITTKENIKINSLNGCSVLDSALHSGVVFEYSCKNGQCGVCKTRLIEGEVVELESQRALTQEEKDSGNILICCCEPTTDIVIDANNLLALKDIEVKIIPGRISSIIKLTGNVVEVNLRMPPNSVFRFLEGQYIDVIGPNQIRRSYSIASCNNQNEIKLYIKKVNNGKLSNYWFDEAKKNDLLRLEGPKGTFYLRENQTNLIFLATGTGIAPIKGLLDQLEYEQKKIKVSLYWGNRSPKDFFWKPEYKNIIINYIPVISVRTDSWEGEYGYIQDILIKQNINLSDSYVYACGSINMIKSAKIELIKNNLNENNFYSDAFVSS